MSAGPTAATPFLGRLREAIALHCGLRTAEIGDTILERAVRETMQESAVDDPESFLGGLLAATSDHDRRLLQKIVRRVTIGETTFFRHPEDIDWLRMAVFPAIRARRASLGERRVRIWSAGCSTGEEAYTLAALSLEAFPADDWEVRILGTDINDVSLETARRSSFREWSFRGVDPADRKRWFESEAGEWRPIRSVRERVEFDYLNLKDPIYPSIFTRTSELDLVVCRNVFIYFSGENAREVLTRMRDAVLPLGFILCGPSDVLHFDGVDGLERVGFGHRLRRVERVPNESSVPPRPSAKSRGTVVPGPRLAPAGKSRPNATIPALLRAGRYEDAETTARENAMKLPDIETRRLLALTLSAKRDPAAIDAWRSVLYLDASDAGGHLGLGMCLMHAGRTADAARHFATVVRLLANHADDDRLPGPDALSVGWVRRACASLATRLAGETR